MPRSKPPQPGHPEQYKPEQVADALRECRGFVSAAAERLGCTGRTVRNYINRYASVRDALTESRERMKDHAESRLLQRMDEGSDAAIIFFLKTQAKDRGYVERQEIAGTDGGPVQTRIVIEYADSDK